MNILIIGAAGMPGRKLTQALIAQGTMLGRPITRLVLADMFTPEAPLFGGEVECVTADLSLPGLEATVSDQIAALRRIAGDGAVAPIRHEPDAAVAAIIGGWAQSFDATRALALGFRAEASFDAIIRTRIDDELQGVLPVAERA